MALASCLCKYCYNCHKFENKEQSNTLRRVRWRINRKIIVFWCPHGLISQYVIKMNVLNDILNFLTLKVILASCKRSLDVPFTTFFSLFLPKREPTNIQTVIFLFHLRKYFQWYLLILCCFTTTHNRCI